MTNKGLSETIASSVSSATEYIPIAAGVITKTLAEASSLALSSRAASSGFQSAITGLK